MKKETQYQKKEPYINTPIWLIEQTSNKKHANFLTFFERQLFCLIHGLSLKEPCYATDEYFSKTFNVTIKHVNSSIQKLCDKRMLFIEHVDNNRQIKTKKLEKLKSLGASNGMSTYWNKDKMLITDGIKTMECKPTDVFCETDNLEFENEMYKFFDLKLTAI